LVEIGLIDLLKFGGTMKFGGAMATPRDDRDFVHGFSRDFENAL
jgi:formate dehydrogenase assembly factor FdhD